MSAVASSMWEQLLFKTAEPLSGAEGACHVVRCSDQKWEVGIGQGGR